MDNKLNILKIFIGLSVFILIAGFSFYRHNLKNINTIKIHYTNNQEIFIDTIAVNKLLIQNKKHIKDVPVENLDLNLVETKVESHPMVKNAEIYLDLEHNFNVVISQPKPIGRVVSTPHYYIDDTGEKMPLSSNYSARVPLVFNLKKENVSNIFKLLKYIEKDMFLKSNITQVKAYPNDHFSLKMRNANFELYVGKAEHLEQKFFNFKAFFIKAEKDSLLSNYKKVNLQYGNQVVCEKNSM